MRKLMAWALPMALLAGVVVAMVPWRGCTPPTRHAERPTRPPEDAASRTGAAPVAGLVGGGATGDPGLPSPDVPTRDVTTAPTCHVTGRVVAPPGVDLAGVTVTCTSGHGDVQTEVRLDDDGSFGGEQVLPGREATLEWIAHADRDAGALASYVVVRHVKAGDDVGVVLVLRPAAMLFARVLAPDGRAIPGAGFLAAERPSVEGGLTPTWELESIQPFTRSVRADDDGRIGVAVRAGHVHLRAIASDGTWGEASRSEVRPGTRFDAGVHRLTPAGGHVRGRVIDADSGEGVASAWLLLDGDVARPDETGEVVSPGEVGADGRFDLPWLGASALPLVAAVGGPHHEPVEVRLTAGESIVELRRRPSLHLHIVARPEHLPGLERSLDHARWQVVPSAAPRSAGRYADPPLVQVRAMMAHGRVNVRRLGDSLEYVAFPVEPGEHTVSLTMPGMPVLKEPVTVSRTGPLHVHVTLPAGPVVEATGPPGVDIAALTAGRPWVLTWRSAEGKKLAVADLPDFGGSLTAGLLLLCPPGTGRVEVQPRTPWTSLVEGTAIDLGAGPRSRRVLDLVPRGSSCLVTFQATLAGEQIPLHAASFIVVRPGERGGLSLQADAAGRAQARLRPGRHRAVSLRRFGEPRWIDFEVPAGADLPGYVDLPVDP